ncbi:UPF0164 family protein [Treponema sp.]|uniref:UPF0164 family protein n=1 Tax=Treponema sp. TaxID=166 RepID=UPI00388E6EC3
MMKKICIMLIFLTFLLKAHSLELINMQSSLADIFASSIDSNEGLTSFRSLNIPSGGRTEALGTAFTGLCDDISFFDYNPAASATLEETQIAVYHNSWISDSAIETLAATARTGNTGYGFQLKCFYVPFSEYNLYGDRVAGSYYTETTGTFNISHNFFAGYLFKGLSLGANAKLSWRGVPDYTDNKDDSIISNSGLEQSALGLMADAGVLFHFNAFKFFSARKANFNIGLALNNLGIVLTGFSSSIQTDSPPPTKLSAGISYRPFSRILFTGEFRKPLNLQNTSSSEKASFAVGSDIKLTEKFSFLCGFLLQGSNPRISMGSEFEFKKILLDVTYTFDLTSSANPVNHISLSAKMKLGDRGRFAAIEQVNKYYLEGLRLYAEGYYDAAVLKWNESIRIAQSAPLNMTFEPAIIAKKIAINFNKNKYELENLYSISFDDDDEE